MAEIETGHYSTAEILIRDDDWTGLTDPVERKKRQNRLHQRAWRRRKAQEKVAAAAAAAADSSSSSSSSSSSAEPPPPSHTSSRSMIALPRSAQQCTKPQAVTVANAMSTLARLRQLADDHVTGRHRLITPRTFTTEAEGDMLWAVLETLGGPQALLAYWGDLQAHRRSELLSTIANNGSPGAGVDAATATISPDHHLFCMIQYNALRGVMANMHLMLRLRGYQPVQEDAWEHMYFEGVTSLPAHAPKSLMPTELQESVVHEAWIDVIPSPGMRDNIIKLQDEIDVDSLCADLMGGIAEQAKDGMGVDRGLVLWGEPWDVENWEVGEQFVKKWKCLMEGCDDLMGATNRWRAVRGEERVVVEVE